jgi:hypothetical protein
LRIAELHLLKLDLSFIALCILSFCATISFPRLIVLFALTLTTLDVWPILLDSTLSTELILFLRGDDWEESLVNLYFGLTKS